MKYEITSTKNETNSKFEIRNSSLAALSDFGILISDFKRLEGVL
jgi:hypothetical protein